MVWRGNKPGCILSKNDTFALVVIACLSLLSSIKSVYSLQYNSEGIPQSLKHILTEDLRTFEAPRWMQQEYPYYLSGYDQYNRPIWILDFGKWDILKVIKMGGKDFEDFDKYFNQIFYRAMATRIRQLTLPTDKPANETIKENEITIIKDLNNYPAAQVRSPKVISYLRKKLKELRPAYDYVSVIYAVNMSKTGKALVSLMKPSLGDIYRKTKMYGTNRDEWIPVLQKNYPRNQLPEYYGGYYNHNSIPLTSSMY